MACDAAASLPCISLPLSSRSSSLDLCLLGHDMQIFARHAALHCSGQEQREREKVRNDFIYAAVSPGSWHNGPAGHGIMSVNICILVGVDRQRYRER